MSLVARTNTYRRVERELTPCTWRVAQAAYREHTAKARTADELFVAGTTYAEIAASPTAVHLRQLGLLQKLERHLAGS